MFLKSKKREKALSAEEYVSSLYKNLLKRSPDPEGFAAHVKFMKNGGDASRVFNTFVNSEEYKKGNDRSDLGSKQDKTLDETILPFKDIEASSFDLEMVIEASRTHFSDRSFLGNIGNVPSLVGRKKRNVETIALYYHQLHRGGIERVTAWQAATWTKMGYRVVLITDESAHENDYSYDVNVQRVVIPGKFMWGDNGKYAARGYALAEVLQDTKADLFVTNLGHEICSVWDILVAKSLGIPAILGWHNVFDADFYDGRGLDAAQIRLLGHRHADLTTVLTTMDQAWFTLNGYSTRVVPNPPTFTELPDNNATLAGKTLIWVARVERHCR